MKNSAKHTPFKSILVANRGEIALRIMKTARQEGFKTIAVYTKADANSEYVGFADQAVLIGDGPVADSYLSIESIIAAAKSSKTDAIHPGYGFLSESADFAQACVDESLGFIGPNAATIAAMGDKAHAKIIMQDAGVKCVPGYEGEDQSTACFQAAAADIGYPVMIKAAAGGGGRGMRLVEKPEDFSNALDLARSEAVQAFGSGKLILEKAIQQPRHIEVQILADRDGTIIHLGERDCSVQRRHQKVIEESPAPAFSTLQRTEITKAAIRAADAIKYEGAGTVEFLLDSDGQFYFLEMNTRLQVEHPVTEMITGLDLVSLQLKIAQGMPLALSQSDITFKGHAIEARLYAEDPTNGFLPSSGTIEHWQAPDSIQGNTRTDSGIRAGDQVSPFYDPMLAKIIAHGETREAARLNLISALRSTALFGVKSNRDFLIDLLVGKDFAEGKATTAYIANRYGEEGPEPAIPSSIELAVLAACWYRQQQSKAAEIANAPTEMLGWASGGKLHSRLVLQMSDAVIVINVTQNRGRLIISVDGTEIDAAWQGNDLNIDGTRHSIVGFLETETMLYLGLLSRTLTIEKVTAKGASGSSHIGSDLLAPMHGTIAEIFASEGDKITKGQRLAILEAMKMQHELLSLFDGKVTEIHVSTGQQVKADDILISISKEDNS